MKLLFILILIQFYTQCKSIEATEQNTNDSILYTTYSLPDQTVQNVCQSMSGPPIIVAVYEGTAAKFYCRLDDEKATWMYSETIKNQTFTPIQQKGRIVIQNRNITIFRTTQADAGVYKCQIGDILECFTILEVLDDNNYIVVNNSFESPHSSTQTIDQELRVFNVWSEWSECSECGKEGTRRRFGMCYVKINSSYVSEFPEGIPCRSSYLPGQFQNVSALRRKKNEIMVATCKVECKQEIFELCSSSGVLLETANNTAGVYSLEQALPPQPPPLAQNILFVARGQRLLVKCPGTTLRDVPVKWRAGSEHADPAVVRDSSGGRVTVSARDRLVIAYVLNEDANLYSCWERDNLAGTVKLVVWAGGQPRWNHHTVLVAMVIIGLALLRLAVRLL